MNFQPSFDESLMQTDLSSSNVSIPNTHLGGCACAACSGVRSRDSAIAVQDAVGNEPGQLFETFESFNDNNGRFRWDQPNGRGTRVDVAYAIADDFQLSGLSVAQSRELFQEALEVWAEVAPIHFSEIEDPGSNDAVEIRVNSDFIDGNSNTLAFAFFPQGGDITFDSGESSWSPSLFLETAVHEIGHSLGLGHDDNVNAIMNSAIQRRFNGPGSAFLFQDDIAGIRSLYGRGVGSVVTLDDTPAPNPTPNPTPNPAPAPSGFNLISGDARNNRLIGTAQRDRIFGRNGNDILNGRRGRDILDGGRGNDRLLGASGDDTLRGRQGRDRLVGGDGNDSLVGGADRDILIGAQPSDNLAGTNEIDTLTGGAGADVFVLGDRDTVFYTNGRAANYAVIRDFNVQQGDVLRLNGRARDYSLGNTSGNQPAGLALRLGQGPNAEIIAIIQGTSNFSLNSNATRFV